MLPPCWVMTSRDSGMLIQILDNNRYPCPIQIRCVDYFYQMSVEVQTHYSIALITLLN